MEQWRIIITIEVSLNTLMNNITTQCEDSFAKSILVELMHINEEGKLFTPLDPLHIIYSDFNKAFRALLTRTVIGIYNGEINDSLKLNCSVTQMYGELEWAYPECFKLSTNRR